MTYQPLHIGRCETRLSPLVRRLAMTGLLLGASFNAMSLDLMQAYEAAKTQDASILAARAAAQAGRERLPQARSQLLPNVAFNVTGNKNQLSSTSTDFLGQERTIETYYPSSNQTLSARQPLYRPQLRAQYRQAQAQVKESEALLQQEEQALIVRVSSFYFEALAAGEQLELVLAQRATVTTQLDAARKIFAAGSGVRTDVDEAQARLDMTLALEIEARQNVNYTLQQLQTMVKQPVEKLATLSVSKFSQIDPTPERLDNWIEKAERVNPQLQALRAQVEIAGFEVEKARAGHKPTLDAVAQWSRSDSESVTNLRSSYTNAVIGLQLNIPIFSGGSVNSAVRQALANQDRAEQTYEAARRDLGLRVHKEFRAVTDSGPRIKALEQAIRSSDQLVLSSRRSFQAGGRTLVDVANAEQQRLIVMRELAQTRYLYLISKLRLQSLAGVIDEVAVADVNSLLQH